MPPPQRREPAADVHFHDGFYLRLGIGLGYGRMSLTQEGDDDENVVSGLAIPIELSLGGTLAPGFVLGIGSFGAALPSPKAESGGEELEGEYTQVLSTIGPFVDYYIWPDQGVHVQAGFAFAVAPFTSRDDETDTEMKISPTGWAAMFGVGYEGWVGEQWGIGALARLQYARVSADEITFEQDGDEIDSQDVDMSGHVLVPALLFTATLH
jgi:hypothetical protein